ncbi:MAG: transposase [Caldivirga sp.]
MDYITLKLPFNADGDAARELLSTAWLFKIATHRVLGVARQQALPGSRIGWKNMFRKIAYGIIPNERYADGVITLVMGVYESCRELGIDFRGVELSDWLMFQQSSLEYPSRNTTLKPNYEFHVTTVRFDGSTGRVVVKPTIPKIYKALLDAVLFEHVKYMGRVVVTDYGVRSNQLWVRGEVHMTVPMDVYYERMARHKKNSGKLIGGVDVNTDRFNLAIIDKEGRLIDHRTFWFSEATARGFPKHSAWSIIGVRIHEMLNYAYHHGVKTLFLENPEVLGRLRLMWIRSGDRNHENYNHKVSIFRSSIIERIAMKAPLYSIETKYVNPRGTTNSKEHDETMKKHGLDKHTTSAYLTALRGLGINKYVHYKQS